MSDLLLVIHLWNMALHSSGCVNRCIDPLHDVGNNKCTTPGGENGDCPEEKDERENTERLETEKPCC